MRIKLAAGTDTGCERRGNEDVVQVGSHEAGVEALLIVCDGMGGHAAGQHASAIALQSFREALAGDGREGAHASRLVEAAERANLAVFEASVSNPAWWGMGTTLVAAVVDSGRLSLVNIGDSPLWLFRKGRAHLLSEDHSWPAEQARLGLLRPDEVSGHPLKHRLARAVGVGGEALPFAGTADLDEGDVICLCSDGIEAAGIDPDELGFLLLGDPEDGVKRVIQRSIKLGAPDNVSLAVALIEKL